jgi:glycosyltransferase involved in cell wall biosynthesis
VLPIRGGPRLAVGLARFALEGWIIHLHTSGNNPRSWLLAAAGAAASRLSRTGAVLTLHSGLLPAYLAASRRRRLLTRTALSCYAQVIAVSDTLAEALAGCGVPESRILVYPAFCSSQLERGRPPAALEEVRRRRSPLLAMAHHPSPVYGRALMLEALRKLSLHHPRIGLAVFGPGTRSPEFLADARAAGVSGRIEDFGELDHASALGLLAQCDAFIRPTTMDGDSISVREALALGVPCVASDACARPPGVVLFKTGVPGELAAGISVALAQGPQRSHAPDAGPLLAGLYQSLDEGSARILPAPASAWSAGFQDETRGRGRTCGVWMT